MLNQVALVGRLVRDPKLQETEKTQLSHITLAVPRSYKNINGEYETDFIDCTLWQGVAKNTVEYCNKGDIVGVKGRLQSNMYEKDGKNVYATNVIVERLSFLSNKKAEVVKEEA